MAKQIPNEYRWREDIDDWAGFTRSNDASLLIVFVAFAVLGLSLFTFILSVLSVFRPVPYFEPGLSSGLFNSLTMALGGLYLLHVIGNIFEREYTFPETGVKTRIEAARVKPHFFDKHPCCICGKIVKGDARKDGVGERIYVDVVVLGIPIYNISEKVTFHCGNCWTSPNK